jgi:hypothetical protein
MWETDPTTLTALATWGLAIGTLLLMYWQTRVTRRLNSASSVMTLRERFDSPPMRRARKHLATRLLNNQHEDITNLEVGAFFELVGTLTHRRVLETDLIWEAFGNWVSAYYVALRRPVDVVARGREQYKDPLIFHEFEWLALRVNAIDRKRMPSEPEPDPAEEDEFARRFLRREADLDTT